jgi:hypothetical protein
MTLPLLVQAVELVPEVYDHLSTRAQVMLGAKAKGDLVAINAQYHDRITQALIDFFESGKLAPSRNAFKRAVVEAFSGAFDLGYTDGGGKLPTSKEANDWLVSRTEAEFGYAGKL